MNIEDTIEELYSCLPGDRNKFNLIMEDMKKKFLQNIKKPNKKSQINKISFNQNNRQNLSNHSPTNNYNNNLNLNLNSKPNPFTSFNINNNNKESLPYYKYEPNLNYKPIKMQDNSNYFNTQRNIYSEQTRLNNFNRIHNKNLSNGFQVTLPDALLINPKPLRTNSQQNLLSDTHANCNFYYPEKNKDVYEGDIDIDGNGWHNQANNIIFNTNDNFYIKNK